MAALGGQVRQFYALFCREAKRRQVTGLAFILPNKLRGAVGRYSDPADFRPGFLPGCDDVVR